jgi:putative oxidoreductase
MVFSKTAKKSGLIGTYFKIIFFLEKFLGPLLFLAIRFWIAQVFWYSGLSKIQSWSTTIMLYKEEYKVPYISPEIAAQLSVAVELSCPIFLVLGLAARLAAIPMLVMTGVIELTYLHSHEHYYWAFLLGLILCYGPEHISLDYFIRKWLCPKTKGQKNL